MDALSDRDKKIEELEAHVNTHSNKLKEHESKDQTISRLENEIVALIQQVENHKVYTDLNYEKINELQTNIAVIKKTCYDYKSTLDSHDIEL